MLLSQNSLSIADLGKHIHFLSGSQKGKHKGYDLCTREIGGHLGFDEMISMDFIAITAPLEFKKHRYKIKYAPSWSCSISDPKIFFGYILIMTSCCGKQKVRRKFPPDFLVKNCVK
jgi:hypothetical protein